MLEKVSKTSRQGGSLLGTYKYTTVKYFSKKFSKIVNYFLRIKIWNFLLKIDNVMSLYTGPIFGIFRGVFCQGFSIFRK